MAIASLSFSAALPVYNSIGTNGTSFGNNSIITQGDITVNTNGAPASSGKATVLTAGLTANGLNYSPATVLVNGNKLTVDYNLTSDNGASTVTDQTGLQTLQAGDQGAALTSGLYGKGITITPEGSQTNGDITTTAYEISLNGPVNGILGTVDQQNGTSFSTSSDGSSLTLEGVSALGNGLQVTYQLSNAQPPAIAQSTSPIGAPDTSNTGLPSSLRGVTTIGELLSNANGLSFSGTLIGALQAKTINQSTGAPNSAGVLAAVLNPTLNLGNSTQFNIGEFINISPNAFPTSAPAQPSTTPNNSFDTSTSNSPLTTSGTNTNNQNNFAAQNSAPTGVYTTFADVGASTIRGSNLNVVA